jgi:murein DD-endopeptidase MepM/ murein hydrolase activator NlpD
LPQFGAQCGIVDILDFPLKPPDAIGTRGGSDFGVFRSRYNGYHTGEDWGISGGSNFGESVFSIGHGLVTHAHPDGWGEDKGTVIIKHTFSDGSIIYSFYGHLDPPSVTLIAGQCVTRGEKIGEIGRPRTPPHLHFEIRAVFPDQPARGYLPYDPSIAGWKPPSNYILEQRITTSPGVVWMRQSSDVVVDEVGFVDESIFLIKEDDQLVAIDLTDGNTLWSQPLARTFVDGSIDRDRSILYTVNRTGDLKAFSLEDAANTTSAAGNLEAIWAVDLEVRGSHQLIPIPGGGVAISTSGGLFAYSSEGELLWEEESLGEVSWWGYKNDQVFLNTEVRTPSIWVIPFSEKPHLLIELTGKAISLDSQYLVYSEDGLLLLESESETSDLIYSFSRPFPRLGSILKLPDGEALIAHSDIHDRRLIALDPAGILNWERSYAQYGTGIAELFNSDSGPIIIVRKGAARFGVMSVLSLDQSLPELTVIFEGGPLGSYPSRTWALQIDGNRLLLNFGGSWMVLLDVQAALDAVT